MAAPIQPGDQIADKYKVDSVLGEGGRGVVLAAVDTQLDRPVAIKVLSTENSKNTQAVERFLQEARAAARLQNEHGVTIYDVGKLPNGSPYIVMELLRGADLSQVLEWEGRLQVPDAVAFLLEACDAIAEAHRHGIVHRDLKPANLFLARLPDGTSRIKVVDFGISKMTTSGESSMSLTQTSLVLGSPVYMSPEQLRSPKDVDARTDIWALGAILYELLLGRPPFLADGITALTAKVLLESLPPPDPKVKLPKGLDHALRKALTKDRELRYGSVPEFVQALAPFAPDRSRELVERMVRLQHAATLTQAGSLADAVADPRRPTLTGSKLYARTPASWGRSASGTARTPRRVAVVWAAAVSLVVGAVGILLMANGSTAEPGVQDAKPASSAATKAPAPAAQTRSAPASPTAHRTPAPADEPEVATDGGAATPDAQPAVEAGATEPPGPVVSSPRSRWRPASPPKPEPQPEKKTVWETYGDRK